MGGLGSRDVGSWGFGGCSGFKRTQPTQNPKPSTLNKDVVGAPKTATVDGETAAAWTFLAVFYGAIRFRV